MKQLTLIMALFMLASCSDENAKLPGNESKDSYVKSKIANRISSTEEYYDFLNPQTKDFIMIEDLRSLNGDVIENNIYAQSRGGQPVDLFFNGESLSGKTNEATELTYWNSTFDARSIFRGNYVSAALKNREFSITSGGNDNPVYIPKMMKVDVAVDSDGYISPGTAITWERDEENKNGVLAGIEYNPESQSNREFVERYPNSIRRFSTIEDNGAYKITEEDLNKFPKGANLTFYVGRISKIIRVDESTERDISVNFYSAVRADLRTEK